MMRNFFTFLAAILAFGTAWYYYQDVADRTATITKLRLKAEDGLVIRAGTKVDEEFIDKYLISQDIPIALADEFVWALDDNPAVRINLAERTFGQDVPSGSFLQRAHFFLPQENAFARRIEPGNRAVSVPVESDRAVETVHHPRRPRRRDRHLRTGRPDAHLRRILEDVEIMAIGGYDTRGAWEAANRPDYNSVTLQAPSAMVEKFLAESADTEEPLTLILPQPLRGRSGLRRRRGRHLPMTKAHQHLRICDAYGNRKAVLPLEGNYYELGGDRTRRGTPGYVHLEGSNTDARHARLIRRPDSSGWQVTALAALGAKLGRRTLDRDETADLTEGTELWVGNNLIQMLDLRKSVTAQAVSRNSQTSN